MTFDVIVLGSGPAGLGAAYRAARSGHRVLLLERDRRVGGLAGSIDISGVRVDLGSHRLHPSIDQRILSDLQALLGDRLQLRRRNGRIRLRGRWLAFPLGAADLVRNAPPAFAVGAARDAVLAPARRPRGEDFAAVLLSSLGRTVCDSFYFPYARKIWGREPYELSSEQARRRVSADSPIKLLRRAVLGSGSGGASGARSFWYPRGGYGEISEALAGAAIAAGADLRLGAEATRVSLGPRGAEVVTGDGGLFRGRRVWSTLPVTVLARLVDPPPPQEVVDAARHLRYRSMLLVYLTLECDRYTPFDAHYFPEAFTPITRLSEPKNYRDGDDPVGRTVLCAELPCDREDAVWTRPDPALGEVVIDALCASGLPHADPSRVDVVRVPYAYPIYDRGYERHFEAIDRWAERLPRLLAFGRQGLFAHDNAHHALSMAWAAADALDAEGSFDERSWAAARRAFAGHVVED